MTLEEYDDLSRLVDEGKLSWPEMRERLKADNYLELLTKLIETWS
jgi:hypothetical protein